MAALFSKKPLNKKPIIIIVSIIAVLLAIILIGVRVFRTYIITDYQGREVTGPYTVSEANAILIDTSRVEEFEDDGSFREVPVHFYYPEGADEKMPLVIFSHGAFGYYQSNTSTYMELASNGFVVASIEHPYHSIFTHDSTGKTIIADRQFLSDSMNIGSSDISEAEAYNITSEWMKLRIDDMNFAIDSLKSPDTDAWFIKEDQKAGVLKAVSLIDSAKIGLMGHSLGGATAVACGRREDISAVIDLDGTMLGENIGINGEEVIINEEPYHTPLLNFQSEEHHAEAVEAERIGYVYSNNVVIQNADTAYNTYFQNSDHMNFTDLPLFSPFLAKKLGTGTVDSGEMIDSLNGIVLRFYECYLKGEGDFTVKEYY
ncbi:MAG: hypothetical protein IKZ76_08755 [Lachnospiraceae bacterium]|nr:hypothetical protein [Lachnospiraceae bacterium]